MSNKTLARKIAQSLIDKGWVNATSDELLAAFISTELNSIPGDEWTPLVRGEMPKLMHMEIQRMAKQVQSTSGAPLHEIIDGIKESQNAEVWLNTIYQVTVRRGGGIVHLSIKRRDGMPCTDWKHKQAMKSQLVGDECEGIELYPAESRLLDSSHQYHIFVHEDPRIRIPVGWGLGEMP